MKQEENKWQPLIDAFQQFSDSLGGVKIKIQENETRLYNCGGLPVDLTLPNGEHKDPINCGISCKECEKALCDLLHAYLSKYE